MDLEDAELILSRRSDPEQVAHSGAFVPQQHLAIVSAEPLMQSRHKQFSQKRVVMMQKIVAREGDVGTDRTKSARVRVPERDTKPSSVRNSERVL